MKDGPVILEGEHVRLEPLSMSHLADLCEIGLDEEIWRWSPEQLTTPAQLQAYVEGALRDREDGTALPFATVLKSEDRAVGTTRFCAIERQHRRLEIGWTWIGTAWQRSVVNTEAKYLMLRHAFESLNCIRVELKTDSLNQRSRNAILRIGAKEEGTFRNHMVTQSGRLRHSVFFSIIDSEWPEVKASLEKKLAG
jgi:RimJ/RimL family protein N-acetyltransferase